MKQISGYILELYVKYMEIFTNEKCEQNCCEHPSERETALIRIMKQDMNLMWDLEDQNRT